MGLMDTARRLFRGAAPDDSESQQWLRDVADFGDDRLARYELYERLYDGVHRVEVPTRLRPFLHGEGIEFSENYLDVVVDMLAEVLAVESFAVADNENASKWINQVMWPNAGFDRLQSTVHLETPKLGDGFLIAEWDEELARPTFHWNHPSQIRPVYSDERDELTYLVKKWSTRAVSEQNPRGRVIWRMNVYFPDRIEKWFSADQNGEVWAKWMEPGELDDDGREVWPTPWIDSADYPLEIPAFHFRHRPFGQSLGRSEMLGAIPFQRELNKQVLDLAEVMDAQGAPTRTATGVPADAALRAGVGDILRSTAKESSFGQLDAADPLPLVETIKATLRRMGSKTGTPMLDLFDGTPPSGESLKTARHRLSKRGEDAQTWNGGTWADATAYGWKLESEFGDDPEVPEYDPDQRITVNWEDVEIRNELDEVTVAEALNRLGVSKRTLIRRLGFDPDDEEKQRADEVQEALDAAASAFDRGGADA